MAHGFDDNKGKVDLNAIFDELETNYQENINTMYDACDSAGVTPTAKTPEAIATAIAGIKTKYETITWTEEFSFDCTADSPSGAGDANTTSSIPLINVKSIKCKSVGGYGTLQSALIRFITSSGQQISQYNLAQGTTYNIPNNAAVAYLSVSFAENASTHLGNYVVKMEITRQTKVLR